MNAIIVALCCIKQKYLSGQCSILQTIMGNNTSNASANVNENANANVKRKPHVQHLIWTLSKVQNVETVNVLVPIFERFTDAHCTLAYGVYVMQNDMCAAFFEYILQNEPTIKIDMNVSNLVSCFDCVLKSMCPLIESSGFSSGKHTSSTFRAWTSIRLDTFPAKKLTNAQTYIHWTPID
jgi:hypothetical protein